MSNLILQRGTHAESVGREIYTRDYRLKVTRAINTGFASVYFLKNINSVACLGKFPLCVALKC